MPNTAWDNRIVEYDPAVPLDQLLAHPRNPKIHPRPQTDALKGILGDVGWLTGLIVNTTTGHVLDGHDRIKAAMEAGQSTAPVFYVSVPEAQEPYILATFDPVGTLAATDSAILDDLLHEVSSDNAAVQALLAQSAEDAGLFTDLTADSALDDPLPLTRADVPDALLPTDNEWGVPLLDLHYQAQAVDLPVNVWGSIGRQSKMLGTYHFYTDDNRFEPLWADPAPVVNSGCINVVEPNFSTNVQMPRAVVLWHVYRKRWLARWWQSHGVRVFVDLAVDPPFAEINLLGVPRAWRAFATYVYQTRHDPQEVVTDWEIACRHTGTDDLLFLVYGGGAPVETLCRERGWVWVPTFARSFYRNVGK